MWIVKPFFLSAQNDFCTLPLNIGIKTFTNSSVKTNCNCIKVDVCCFEYTLAFLGIHGK